MRKRKRVLLKLSGEALLGPKETKPYDPETLLQMSQEVGLAHEQGREIAIVIGGGNIFRGATGASKGMKRSLADKAGMLATIQNGVFLLDMLERVCGIETRLMSGLGVNSIAEPYIDRRAVRHLEKRRVVILAGGTGNPYCTTDYAAALRANELDAKFIAKATNIDGVYDKDPRQHADAKLLRKVGFERCINEQLGVMDTEAFALCRSQNMPIRVFSLAKRGNITKALTGANIGSLIS